MPNNRLQKFYFFKEYTNILGMSSKNQIYPSRTGDISIFFLYREGSKPTNKLTDIQDIQKYLKLIYKDPRNVFKEFQKDMWSKTGDIPIFV